MSSTIPHQYASDCPDCLLVEIGEKARCSCSCSLLLPSAPALALAPALLLLFLFLLHCSFLLLKPHCSKQGVVRLSYMS